MELMQRQWEDRWANITTALEQDAQNIRTPTAISANALESIKLLEHSAMRSDTAAIH